VVFSRQTCICGDEMMKNEIGRVVLITSFLDAFAKLRKATINFVMSVRLSIRMGQLISH
jgi:hypothetical protein